MELTGARWEFGQFAELRFRTPDALNERGRDELTGINGNELFPEKGSAMGVLDLCEGGADRSMAEDVGRATKI